MKCATCDHINPDGAKFCSECGVIISLPNDVRMKLQQSIISKKGCVEDLLSMEESEEFWHRLIEMSKKEPDEFIVLWARFSESEKWKRDPSIRLLLGEAYMRKAASLFKSNNKRWEDAAVDLLIKSLTELKLADDYKLECATKRPIDEKLEARIDIVASTLERNRPGMAQEILGKTKLKYFADRLLVMNPQFAPSEELLSVFGNIFFQYHKIVRAAMLVSKVIGEGTRQYIRAALYEETTLNNPSGQPSKMVGLITLYRDGSVEMDKDFAPSLPEDEFITSNENEAEELTESDDGMTDMLAKIANQDPDRCLEILSNIIATVPEMETNSLIPLSKGLAYMSKAGAIADRCDEKYPPDSVMFDYLETALINLRAAQDLDPAINLIRGEGIFRDIDVAAMTLEHSRPGAVSSAWRSMKLKFLGERVWLRKGISGTELAPSEEEVRTFQDIPFTPPCMIRSLLIPSTVSNFNGKRCMDICLFEETEPWTSSGEMNPAKAVMRLCLDGTFIEKSVEGLSIQVQKDFERIGCRKKESKKPQKKGSDFSKPSIAMGEYSLEPFIANIGINQGVEEAAKQLEEMLNAQAQLGSRYLRLESIKTIINDPGVPAKAGCFGIGAEPGLPPSHEVVGFDILVCNRNNN